MTIRLAHDKDKALWNAIAAHPLQSWEWGEAKKKNGTMIDRCIIEEDTTRVYLLTYHPIAGKYSIAYCGRSPWPGRDALLLSEQARKRGCIAIKLEPQVYENQAGENSIPLLHSLWKENGVEYKRSDAIIAPHTFLIDLRLPEKTLLSLMKPKTRYNIRVAQKKDVKILEEDSIHNFYPLYASTMQRQKYHGRSSIYIQNVWESMRKHARIFTAFYNHEPLASYMLFYWNKTAYYLYGGTNTVHKEVMASNLLMWEVIMRSKKDCHIFDMWGALPKAYDPHDPWAGFHRFKEGYGGQHISFIPSHDIVLSPLYWGYELAWRGRNMLLGVKH